MPRAVLQSGWNMSVLRMQKSPANGLSWQQPSRGSPLFVAIVPAHRSVQSALSEQGQPQAVAASHVMQGQEAAEAARGKLIEAMTSPVAAWARKRRRPEASDSASRFLPCSSIRADSTAFSESRPNSSARGTPAKQASKTARTVGDRQWAAWLRWQYTSSSSPTWVEVRSGRTWGSIDLFSENSSGVLHGRVLGSRA